MYKMNTIQYLRIFKISKHIFLLIFSNYICYYNSINSYYNNKSTTQFMTTQIISMVKYFKATFIILFPALKIETNCYFSNRFWIHIWKACDITSHDIPRIASSQAPLYCIHHVCAVWHQIRKDGHKKAIMAASGTV